MPKPNFFIVGAPRCGTTALYQYLQQHPDIFMPYRKEPMYFGSDLPKRQPHLNECSYVRLFRAGGQAARRGEASVWYLYSESAPREIADFCRDPRILIMVRNPADMIASLHSHLLFITNEDIASLSEALEAENDRSAGRRLPGNVWWPRSLLYREMARFAPHIERYFEVFGRERVKVVLYDDLQVDAPAIYRSVLAFLEVDPQFVPRFEVVNRNKKARSRRLQQLLHAPATQERLGRLPPRLHHLLWRTLMKVNITYADREPISPGLRAQLLLDLQRDVIELEQLLRRPLPSWKPS